MGNRDVRYLAAQAIFKRYKLGMRQRKRGESIAKRQKKFLRTVQDVQRVEKYKRKRDKSPRKVNIQVPAFGQEIPLTGMEGRDFLPFGFLIPTHFEQEIPPVSEQELEAVVGNPQGIRIPIGPPSISWDPLPNEPASGEITITPNPILWDNPQAGQGVDKGYVENYTDINFPYVPAVGGSDWELPQMPEINLPDIGGFFGDLGKWGLIALAAVAVLILGRDKK